MQRGASSAFGSSPRWSPKTRCVVYVMIFVFCMNFVCAGCAVDRFSSEPTAFLFFCAVVRG